MGLPVDPPIATHNGWKGHCQDLVRILSPLTDPDTSPEDVMVYIDNAADGLCPVHAAILVHAFRAVLVSLEMEPDDVREALAGLAARPDETVPFDTNV